MRRILDDIILCRRKFQEFAASCTFTLVRPAAAPIAINFFFSSPQYDRVPHMETGIFGVESIEARKVSNY